MSETTATRNVCIENPQGIHARPAELLARCAMKYESDIEVIKEDLRIDAKSILHILTLGATQGTQLVLEARGADAEAALDALVELVQSNFAVNEQT